VADGRRAQLAIAGLCTAGFTIALAALVSSQLALMSVLDTTRAERAADQIASSQFTADLIEQTVERAVEPITGPQVAAELATATSSDPRVIATVSSALVNAHRVIVDPTASASSLVDGNAVVDQAIVQSLTTAADRSGVDPATLGADVTSASIGGVSLADLSSQAKIGSVVPTSVPELGLRRVAETTRIIAGFVALLLGLIAVFAHPRPGRAARGLGWSVAIVCAAWLAGLLVAGWAIRLTSTTLFGEMLHTVWSDAVPSMLLLVGAGAFIGAGIWFAGTAFDGYDAERHRARDQPSF
jgi:hypothetical protein